MFFDSLLASSLWSDITQYFTNTNGATNTCRTAFLWIAIAFALVFIVCKLAVCKEKQPLVNKIALAAAIAFAAACIVTFAVCSFIEDELVAITFYPLLVFAVLCVIGALTVAVRPIKAVKIAAGAVIAASFIAALICMIVYYASGDALEWYYLAEEDVNSVGLYVSAVVLVVAIVLIAFFADGNAKGYNARSLTFAAVCVALAFALSYVRFFKMPMGGSITFASMLPIMLYSYMFGCRKGVIAGLVYGVLQAVQDPWLLHPAQFLLDYGVAFAAIGLTGCIKGFHLFDGKPRLQFALGGIAAGVLRFISHFFSGAFAFGSYGAGYAAEYGIGALNNQYVYSFIYQCLYVIPEVIIVVVVGVLLLSSKNFLKQVERYSAESRFTEKKAESAAVADASGQTEE